MWFCPFSGRFESGFAIDCGGMRIIPAIFLCCFWDVFFFVLFFIYLLLLP